MNAQDVENFKTVLTIILSLELVNLLATLGWIIYQEENKKK